MVNYMTLEGLPLLCNRPTSIQCSKTTTKRSAMLWLSRFFLVCTQCTWCFIVVSLFLQQLLIITLDYFISCSL